MTQLNKTTNLPVNTGPRTIPAWVNPLASAENLNGQDEIARVLQNRIAKDELIPIVLGQAQVGGKIFAVDYDQGTDTWTVGYAWCVGEINSVVQVYLNGAAPVSGVTVNSYTGTTSQTADSLLSAAISGYTDTLVITRPGGNIGISYSVIQYTSDDYSDFPEAVAEVQGLKTNGGAYSVSPAYGMEYLIESAILGPGGTADATSLGTVATDNAATVTTEARREIGLVISKQRPFNEWLKTLATYASCWITKRGSTYYFVSDRPRTQDAALTTNDWLAGSFSMRGPGKTEVPTVVEIVYTDTTETIWREEVYTVEASGVSAGSTPRRVSRVRMPGVTRRSQAGREATERLNKLQNMHPTVTFTAFDSQMVREIGDVIDVTRGSHLTNVDFRIVEPPVKSLGGGVQIRASKYDATVYSDIEPSTSFGTRPPVTLGPGVDVPQTVLYREDFTGKTLAQIQADWSEIIEASGEESLITDSGTLMGSTVWQLGNTSGNDEVSRALKRSKRIPIVEGQLYRAKCIMSREGGTAPNFYFGLAGIADDGTTWVNTTGADSLSSQHYYGANNYTQTADGNYEEIVCYFRRKQGRSPTPAVSGVANNYNTPGSAAYIHADAHFAVPLFYANYNDADGTHRISYIEVTQVESESSTAVAPTGAHVLKYNNLDTGALGGGVGHYRFTDGTTGYADWETVTDGSTITRIDLDPRDRDSLYQTPIIMRQQAGDMLTWRQDSGRWVTFELTGSPTVDLTNANYDIINIPVTQVASGTGNDDDFDGTNLNVDLIFSGQTDQRAGAITHYQESFDDNDLDRVLGDWASINDGGGDLAISTDVASPTGQYVLQIGDNSGDDEVYRVLPPEFFRIPIEQDKLYVMRVIAQRVNGTSNAAYFGVRGFQDDGTTPEYNGSSDWYVAASNVTPTAGSYALYEGFFKRTGGAVDATSNTLAQPYILGSDVHFVTPFFAANNDNAAGQWRIAYIELRQADLNRPTFPGGPTIVEMDSLTTGSLTISGQYQFHDGSSAYTAWADVTKAGNITELRVHANDRNGINVQPFVARQKTGDTVTWKDSLGRWIAFDVTGTPTFNSAMTVITLPVTLSNFDGSDDSSDLSTSTINVEFHMTGAGEIKSGLDKPIYIETFADNDLARILGDWSHLANINGEESIVTDTASPVGQYVWQLGNNSGNDEVARALNRNVHKIPIEDDVLYVCRFIVQNVGGTSNNLYLGVAGVDETTGAWVNASGLDTLSNQHYFARSGGVPASGSYDVYEGYFKRTGASPDVQSGVCPRHDPGILHADADYVVPLFYCNNSAAAGQYRIALVEVRPVDSGAVIGTDIIDTDGTVRTGPELKNDYKRSKNFSGSLNPNPYFHDTFVDSDGNVRPVDWYVRSGSSPIGTYVYYVDETATNRQVNVTGGTMYLVSAAFEVNHNAEYEVKVRARSVGSSQTAQLAWYAKDSDLSDGKLACLPVSTGSVDTEIDTATITVESTNISCTTSFQIFTWDIGAPADASNIWASIAFIADSSEQFEVDYLMVREKNSLGAPSGTKVHNTLAQTVGNTIDGEGVTTNLAIDDGGGTYRPAVKGFQTGTAFDGDTVTFDISYNTPPEVGFFMGGLTEDTTNLTGDVYQDFQAIDISTTGFDAELKLKETVGSTTLRTDSTTSTPSSPSGQDVSINKGQTAEAYDNQYTFQFDVNVTNGSFITETSSYEPGFVTVGLYTNDGVLGWVKAAERVVIGTGATQTEVVSNVSKTISVTGLGLNDDFAVSVESSTYGGSINNFDQVTYYTATAPTSASATAGTSGVRYWVMI